MKILFDCTNITVGGGVQVANSFLKYAFKSSEISYCYLLSTQVVASLEADQVGIDNLNVINTKPTTLLPGSRTMRKIRAIEKDFQPDLTFTLFGPAYWKSQAPHIVGFARPHYILHHSPFFAIENNRRLIRYMAILANVHNYLFRKNSDYLFVENESMVPALFKKYKKTVFYVPNTYNQAFENFEPVSGERPSSEYRLLTISSDYPHKNLDCIPLVVSELVKKYPEFRFKFIVTVNEDERKISNEHVSYIGPVKIEQCPELYESSDVMFLPTLLECFSASYVEAMFMNLPILTSDLDFLRSICGEAAVYFDPLNAEDIADQIFFLASDKHRQKELVDKGQTQLQLFGSPGERYNRFVKIFKHVKGDKIQNLN